MARVRGVDTKPELIVRRLLHALGYRFRLHRRDLAGSPDIVLPRRRRAVFVHGCFWHRHEGCRLASSPKTRRDFWEAKFTRNVERDARAVSDLRRDGWAVTIVWECETRSPQSLATRLQEELGPPGAGHK
jgi:DNA mismatch endonuclease (patch repair protein)